MTHTIEDFEIIYILGYWVNPYGSHDREYYWMRCEDGAKTARQWGTRKQTNGQPTRFTNWVKGGNKYFKDQATFIKAANKAGINPNLSRY